MRLTSSILSLALLGAAATPLAAQLRSNRPPPRVQTLPRLLVATPYPANTSDSAAAIRVGDGMRRRLEDVAGKTFNVIPRDRMNEALLQYAYPADAVLPTTVARTLATQLQARFIVSSSLARSEAGRYALQVRAVGLNDKAGFTTTLQQIANQSLEDLGKASAEALGPAFKALDDAKDCWDKQVTKPEDAIESARKALRIQANHGLAEYCLGEIAQAQAKPQDAIIGHYKNATIGDPQSLEAWSQLAMEYQKRNDSLATVKAFQEMLRVAPTNQPLREQAFKLFLNYGQPGAAKEVAEEGLELDPSNADLWDLKSNACLYLEDFNCAVDALEQVFEVDSAKADSLFYFKIGIAASQRPDTARLLKWARRGAQKYPYHAQILGNLVTAYAYAGPPDSTLSAVRRLMAVDSTDLRPALRTIQILAGEGRVAEAAPIGAYVERLGDQSDKENYAGILANNGALPKLQSQPQDLEGAATMSRKAVSLAVPGGRIAVFANYLLGLATAFQVYQLDPKIMEQKSCELAQKSSALAAEAVAAFEIGRSIQPDGVAQHLATLKTFGPRIESQVKAFCR